MTDFDATSVILITMLAINLRHSDGDDAFINLHRPDDDDDAFINLRCSCDDASINLHRPDDDEFIQPPLL